MKRSHINGFKHNLTLYTYVSFIILLILSVILDLHDFTGNTNFNQNVPITQSDIHLPPITQQNLDAITSCP